LEDGPAAARHPDPASLTPAALKAGLRELMVLRSIAICGQSAAIAVASYLGVALPLGAMATVVALLVAVNVLTWMWLRTPRPASHADIAANVGLDLIALTTLLYLAGGATNPFSLLFVLHGVLMALLLPPLAAASGTAVAIACYTVLWRVYEPLQMATGEPLPAALRLLGMELSLALTVASTAWFVGRIVLTLRDHERRLSEAVQRALRDDAVLRVGALAAGAAHELSAPLATMAVLAGEIRSSAQSDQVLADAENLRAQIERCRNTIADLMAAAGHAQAANGGPERLDRFLESIVDACRAARPEATIQAHWPPDAAAAQIFGDASLRQALLVLLNNAVDASPAELRFGAVLSSDTLRVEIVDRGSGIPARHLPKLGQAFFTTKPRGKGAGLGLVVAARAIERLGGTL
jgi:two-component system sensor histidine kinase RegB